VLLAISLDGGTQGAFGYARFGRETRESSACVYVLGRSPGQILGDRSAWSAWLALAECLNAGRANGPRVGLLERGSDGCE
jgi:hypothetical protein